MDLLTSFHGYGGYIWASVGLVVGGLLVAFLRLNSIERKLCQQYLANWQEEHMLSNLGQAHDAD